MELTVTPHLHYRDPDAARLWLERAFGLETELLVSDSEGRLVFARLSGVGIGREGADGEKSPLSVGGANTQMVSIRKVQDIDAHRARAAAAGARILREPRQEFYGDLDYVAVDLEGHLWSFGQSLPDAAGRPPDGWTIRFPNQEAAS